MADLDAFLDMKWVVTVGVLTFLFIVLLVTTIIVTIGYCLLRRRQRYNMSRRNRHIVTQNNSAYSHPHFTQSLSISTNTVDSTVNPTEPLVNNVMYAEILL
uniref:Uncharacterized protein n=1 Tax=Amphimedon queenslandica TaxID=400682 RepID=A0A1X7VW75_AMPQE